MHGNTLMASNRIDFTKMIKLDPNFYRWNDRNYCLGIDDCYLRLYFRIVGYFDETITYKGVKCDINSLYTGDSRNANVTSVIYMVVWFSNDWDFHSINSNVGKYLWKCVSS